MEEKIFEDKKLNSSFLSRKLTLYLKACYLFYNCSSHVAIGIKTPQNQLRTFCSTEMIPFVQDFLTTQASVKYITQEKSR